MLTERSFGGKRGFVDFVIYEFYRYLRQGRVELRRKLDQRATKGRVCRVLHFRNEFASLSSRSNCNEDRFDPLSRQTFLQNHV